jgi:hypothetical protein
MSEVARVQRAPVYIKVRHFWDSEICTFPECDHVATHGFVFHGGRQPLCGPHGLCVQRIQELAKSSRGPHVQQMWTDQAGQYARTQAFGFDPGQEPITIVFDNIRFTM